MPPAQQQQQQQQQHHQHHVSPAVSKLSQDTIAPRQLAPPLFQDTIDSQTQNALQGSVQASSTISQKHQRHQTPLLPQQPQIVVPPERPSSGTPTGTEQATLITQQGLIIDISEADTEEIRKLKQEFEKKMQRAQKSYGTRMDNLHRSKEEAEALHQATLQKHEKERTEFDKRVRLAEEEQARRLNQIQKEFNEKKEGVRHQQMDKAGAAIQRLPLTSTCSEGGGGALPPIPEGHKRSNSHFDSSLHMNKGHKRCSSDCNAHGVGGAAREETGNSAPANSSFSQKLLQDGGPQQQQLPTATAHRPSGTLPMSSGEVVSHPHQTPLPPNLPESVRSSGQGGQKQVAAVAGEASASVLRDRSGSSSS